MADFTPTSGMGFSDWGNGKGAFNLGMEVFFSGPGEARRRQMIGLDIAKLTFQGGVCYRPRSPEYGTFGSVKSWVTDALVRVTIYPGSSVDGGKGITMVARPLKATLEPVNEAIDTFTVWFPPSQTSCEIEIVVEATAVGGGWPTNFEMHLNGFWESAARLPAGFPVT